jgi:hypothetical protein
MANGRNCEERGGRKEFGQYCRLIFEPKSTGSRGEYSLAATISLGRRGGKGGEDDECDGRKSMN